MKPALQTSACLFILMFTAHFSLFAQNDGYQKSGNDSGTRPANPRNNYATPGDQQQYNNGPAEVKKDDPLRGGNFTIGSGFGYVNAITTVKIDNGNNIQEGGNSGYQLHLTPEIGYFISRNFAFGLGMDYLVSSSKDNSNVNGTDAKTSDTKVLFGPFTRLFFPFAGDQALFLGGVYAYGKSQTEIVNDQGSQNVNTTLMTFGVGPGYAIFSNGKVSLEAQAKYNYGISRNTLRVDSGNQSTRTLTEAWDFTVGMHFYFSRRRN